MNAKIERKLNKIDAKLKRLLDELEQYSDEKLNQKPNEHAWSVLQIMHHLLTAEELSTKYVKKKLSFNPTLDDINWWTRWRVLLLRSYNYLPIKLKAPKAVREHLPDRSTFAETSKKWLATRNELRDFFNAVPDEILKKEVYKHIISGRLGLEHMLDFFNGHFDRHVKQIKRTLEN